MNAFVLDLQSDQREISIGPGTKSTLSNVAKQLGILDTGGHETNHSGQCKDESRRLQPFEQGSSEKVAGRRNDQFRDCAGAGENRGEGHSQ